MKEKKLISFFVSIFRTTLIDKPDNPIRYMTPLIVHKYPNDTQDFKQEFYQDILPVLVWGVCAAKEHLALVLKMNNTINLVINAMEIFPRFLELMKNCIGVLWFLFSVLDNFLSFVLDGCIHALVRLIEESDIDEDVTALAMNVFMTLTLGGHQVTLLLHHNESLIDTVIG